MIGIGNIEFANYCREQIESINGRLACVPAIEKAKEIVISIEYFKQPIGIATGYNSGKETLEIKLSQTENTDLNRDLLKALTDVVNKHKAALQGELDSYIDDYIAERQQSQDQATSEGCLPVSESNVVPLPGLIAVDSTH